MVSDLISSVSPCLPDLASQFQTIIKKKVSVFAELFGSLNLTEDLKYIVFDTWYVLHVSLFFK